MLCPAHPNIQVESGTGQSHEYMRLMIQIQEVTLMRVILCSANMPAHTMAATINTMAKGPIGALTAASRNINNSSH